MRRALTLVLLALSACGAPAEIVDAGVQPVEDTDAGTGTDAGTCDTWATWGHEFFSNTCNGCHGFTHTDVRAQRDKMSEEISSGRMPQTGPLDEPARSRVLAYLACGAPE